MFCDFEYQPKFNGSIHTICSAYLCDSYGHAHLINKRAKPFFFLFSHHLLIVLCNLPFFVGEIIASFECFVVRVWNFAEVQILIRFLTRIRVWYRCDIWFCVRVHASVVFNLCLINTFFHIFSMKEKKTRKNTQ